MKAYTKDILRTIKREKKRFVALSIITLLGVVVLTGIKTSCIDLRNSADVFFDQQELYDISVQSTLGLSDEDMEALKNVSGIEQVEGDYSETVYTLHEDKQESAALKIIHNSGINQPYLLNGKLPSKKEEIAVTSHYLTSLGKTIGDTVKIEKMDEDNPGKFLVDEFIITGEVIDPMDINFSDGITAFRSTSTTDYTFFILEDAIEYDVYTSAYLIVKGASSLSCFSEEYEMLISNMTKKMEGSLKKEREQERAKEIKAEAQEELDQEKAKAEKELADAEQKLIDSQKEIDDGQKEIIDGQQKINEGYGTLYANQRTMQAEFEKAYQQIEDGYTQVEAGEEQLNLAIQQFEAQKEYMSEEEVQAMETQLAQQKATLEATRAQLDSNKELLVQKEQSAETQIANGLIALDNSQAELNAAQEKLNEGQEELNKGKKEFEEKKKEALEKIEDAQQEIDEIENAKWYIQDRQSLSGFMNVSSDSNCIEAIGNVFPIVFLIVAILISLTTTTRMIEEERGLIGTYKALGFSDRSIRLKYTIFALGASVIGGILGDLCGFIALPKFLFTIFSTMYQIPRFYLSFNWQDALSGLCLFAICMYLAAFISCHEQLKQQPATLMRPLSPVAGKMVLLERIPFIWNRLSFLNKVTARNIFRYKKRLFMTIGGIMGCTALLVCGFAIKDSVAELLPNQYEKINQYDILSVASKPKKLFKELNSSEDIASYQDVYITNMTISTSKANETVQIIVVPDDASLAGYISLLDHDTQEILELSNKGMIVTNNLSIILDFKVGDSVTLQDLTLEQSDVQVDGIVTNYLGNMIYMKESVYASHFGSYDNNGALIKLKNSCKDPIQFADRLSDINGVMSAVSTASLKENFNDAFELINMVVYIIIVLAASLAFVVLFTLSTTNISERERELSTIKVLGFYDHEVHLYVNKETLLLTCIGILLGLPMGTILGKMLTQALDMPSIYFAVYIHDISYYISAGLCLLFAFLVNFLTNHFVDRINPIEALKSVE